jgi:hypothetical protein
MTRHELGTSLTRPFNISRSIHYQNFTWKIDFSADSDAIVMNDSGNATVKAEAKSLDEAAALPSSRSLFPDRNFAKAAP